MKDRSKTWMAGALAAASQALRQPETVIMFSSVRAGAGAVGDGLGVWGVGGV